LYTRTSTAEDEAFNVVQSTARY